MTFRQPIDHAKTSRNYFMDRDIASADRAASPSCTEAYKFYFLRYFGSIFASIFCLKNKKNMH